MSARSAALALFAAAVTAGVAPFAIEGALQPWLINGSWTLAAAGALLASLVCVRELAPGDPRRPAWRLLAAACGLWLFGQLSWNVYALTGVLPGVPSFGDLGYLGFALVATIAIARLVPAPVGLRRFVALDTAIVAGGAAALGIVVNWSPLEDSALSLPGKIVAVAYASLYLAVVGRLLQTMLRPSMLGGQRELLPLLAGVTVQAAAFVWWAPQLLDESYVLGGIIDLAWTLGLVLIGMGALMAPRRAAPLLLDDAAVHHGVLFPAVVLLATLIAGPVAMSIDASEGIRYTLWIGAALMALLLGLRSWLLSARQLEVTAAARAARAELDRYHRLSPAMLAVANAEGRFVSVNPAFEATLGHPVAELVAQPFFAYVHPDDIPGTEREMQRLNAGEPSIDFENRYRHADGSYRWLLWRSTPADDGLIYAAALDVTALREAQDELARIAADLDRSNTDLERFAYAASHDLAEPLRTISSFSQLVMRETGDELGEKPRRHLTHVVEGAERMRTLIDAMLQYSRVGRQRPAADAVDLGRVVAQAVEQLGAQLTEAGASVTHGDLPVVTGHEEQLTRLVQNLVSNGVKFRGDDPPRVHVEGARENGGWHVTVRDNGLGIEPRHQERVFAMFERLHSRAEFPGTGIGLAMCSKIVEQHGGRIWVESEAGRGSTFHFTIHDQKASSPSA